MEAGNSRNTDQSKNNTQRTRQDGLKLIDEQFREMYSREYALDHELDLDDFDQDSTQEIPQVIQELCQKAKDKKKKKKSTGSGKNEKSSYVLPAKYYDEIATDESDDEKVIVNLDMHGGKNDEDRLDCESFLSKCSTLYNHPKLIIEPEVRGEGKSRIVVNSKSGVPEVSTRLTSRNLKQLNDESINNSSKILEGDRLTSIISSLNIRSKDESKEEKKVRKNLVKEHRRERRIERKLNQSAFKEEEKKQKHEASNVRPGIKLA